MFLHAGFSLVISVFLGLGFMLFSLIAPAQLIYIVITGVIVGPLSSLCVQLKHNKIKR